MQVDNTYIIEECKLNFGEKLLLVDEPYGMLNIEVDAHTIIHMIAWFKSHPVIKANFLTDLCGAHFPDLPGREFCVIYHLQSMENNIRIRLKCFLPASQPVITSITHIYAAANWMERETFDFYGITFAGHPNLTRILNVDEMNYFPLRKEFPLEDATRTDKDDSYFGR